MLIINLKNDKINFKNEVFMIPCKMLKFVDKDMQDELFNNLNNFSKSHKILGHLCAIPVAILDGAMEIAKIPLTIIGFLVLAAINLVGAVFSEKYKYKDALNYTAAAFMVTLITPIHLVKTSLNLMIGIFFSVIDPETVSSIRRLSRVSQTLEKCYSNEGL